MEFLLNLNSWFKSLPASGKISLLLVIVGAVTAGILLQSEIRYSNYQYLYTNLTGNDVNAIAERLESMNVDAQIVGDAIKVPGENVLELRNTLAEEGLPRGAGTGFEIFDEGNFGATEFQQKVNYVRALQGELARTLSALENVDRARVHLVLPERSLFQRDSEEPSASVALRLHRGRELSSGQVSGVLHLVTTGVERLKKSNVNIIDDEGNVLHRASDEAGAHLSAQHLDLKKTVESDFERRVENMLERVVGSGGASVNVSAKLDFSQVERTVEEIDPESRIALSEQIIRDSSEGSRGGQGGAPGAASNLPGGEGASGGSAHSESSERTEESFDYAVSRTTERIVQPSGGLEALSVAVLVDGNYEEGEEGMTYQPRDEEELTRLEELVKRAVGFDPARGDEVQVDNMQFQPMEELELEEEDVVTATTVDRLMEWMMNNGRVFGIILAVGFIFILLVRLINSYAPPMNVAYANLIGEQAGNVANQLPSGAPVNIVQRDDDAAKEKAKQLQEKAGQPQQQASEGKINVIDSAPEITVEAPMSSEEKLKLQAAKGQAEKLINENIDDAVRTVRAWLAEE